MLVVTCKECEWWTPIGDGSCGECDDGILDGVQILISWEGFVYQIQTKRDFYCPYGVKKESN